MNGVKSLTMLGMCLLAAAGLLGGCGPNETTPAQLTEFQKAGPIEATADLESLRSAKVPVGPYRVVAGDLLTMTIPSMAAPGENAPTTEPVEQIIRRVDEQGKIRVPVAGEVAVGGLTLTEIEEAVSRAFAGQMVAPPAVVVQVSEYRTVYVTIIGAVNAPGRYQLRSDELSLVALLTKAGGIAPTGANAIKVILPVAEIPSAASQPAATQPGKEKELAQTFILPLKGASTPFMDVPLTGGETIEVQKLAPQLLTILGLVRTPGAYPIQVESQTNLIQALGIAGGVDPVADPRYVVVYRQATDGRIVSARFKLNAAWNDQAVFTDSSLASAAFVHLKPGDVVMVEHNTHTRTRQFLNRYLTLNLGAGAGAYTNITYYDDRSPPGRNDVVNTRVVP